MKTVRTLTVRLPKDIAEEVERAREAGVRTMNGQIVYWLRLAIKAEKREIRIP